MQCSSHYIFGCGLIADLEGDIINNTCVLTDIVWITSEEVNPVARSRVDFGNAAIAKFRSRHVHNEFCRRLGLEKVGEEANLDQRVPGEGNVAPSRSDTRTRMTSLLN